MGVELRPFGVKCNIQCQYCYQNPQRDAGNVLSSYDLVKIRQAIEKEGGPFTLFGGEALMVPEKDLEELWAWGFEKYGANNVQTNGVLINENHIRMFKAYRVHVGISIDGPGELNDVRWAGTLERTRKATAATHLAIGRLCEEGIPPSLIVTLHRCNATADKLPRMHEWFRMLARMGVRSVRLHILEVDSEVIRERYALSNADNLAALLSFAELEEELSTLKFDLFREIGDLLLGDDEKTTCTWNACDPYTTAAVRGVEGSGQSSNCGRTNKDGIDFAKSPIAGFERYIALYHTPQEDGGCKGCRFFLMCKGQCPGTAIDGDWRNRSEHCELWKGLFGHCETLLLERGTSPLSLRDIRPQLESLLIDGWVAGRNSTIASALQRLEGECQKAVTREAKA